MAVEALGEEPDERSQKTGLDLDLIGVQRPSILGRAHLHKMVPASNQRIMLAGLDLAGLFVDALDEDGVHPEWNQPKKVRAATVVCAVLPGLGQRLTWQPIDPNHRAGDLPQKRARLHERPGAFG